MPHGCPGTEGSPWEVALTGEASVLRRGVMSGLPAGPFRLSQQRCCRRWLWQGLRGLAEADRGHTGTGDRSDHTVRTHGTGSSFLLAPVSQSPACARAHVTLCPRWVLTLLFAVPRQCHGAPAARQERQGGRHEPVYDAALPGAQLQAPVWGGNGGVFSAAPSPQAPATAPSPAVAHQGGAAVRLWQGQGTRGARSAQSLATLGMGSSCPARPAEQGEGLHEHPWDSTAAQRRWCPRALLTTQPLCTHSKWHPQRQGAPTASNPFHSRPLSVLRAGVHPPCALSWCDRVPGTL